MKRSHSRRTSGRRVRDRLKGPIVAVLAAVLLTGCSYGFQGGGFPPHIRTVYIAPFQNQTPQFDLAQKLYTRMLEQIPARLGVQVAGEEAADAVIRGEIRRYDDVARNYQTGSGNQPVTDVASHEVQVTVVAELIDIRDNVIRWEGSVTGRGTYRPDTQSDDVGQIAALENVIEQIVDGAQSQW